MAIPRLCVAKERALIGCTLFTPRRWTGMYALFHDCDRGHRAPLSKVSGSSYSLLFGETGAPLKPLKDMLQGLMCHPA